MSIDVTPEELPDAVALYGPTAYVLTGDADGRPRVTHCATEVGPGLLRIRLGRSAAANARERPAVSVLWPATKDQSMSLIADGVATVRGEPGAETAVEIEVTGAVRHRPAPSGNQRRPGSTEG